eukprot:12410088-Karenia_brevis.AAC.1
MVRIEEITDDEWDCDESVVVMPPWSWPDPDDLEECELGYPSDDPGPIRLNFLESLALTAPFVDEGVAR